jgi:hypothetical protein
VANRVDTVFEGCGDKEPIVHRLIHWTGDYSVMSPNEHQS